MRARALLASIACASLILLAAVARADAPPLLPVQGTLETSADQPVTGTHDLTFSIFASQTGGAPIYTETSAGVTFTGGAFVVYLGQTAAIDLALFRDQTTLWLEVTIDGSETVQPRMRLATVPYSAYATYCGSAATLGNKTAGDFADATAVSTLQTSLASHTHAFSTLTAIPTGLSDGDNDTLGALACGTGQIAKYNGAWECAADANLTEAQVDTMVSNNGYALSASLATVATTGAYSNLIGIPTTLTTSAGTTGYLPVFTGATQLGDSHLFDLGGSIGLGTATPGATLDVRGGAQFNDFVHVRAYQTDASTLGQGAHIQWNRDASGMTYVMNHPGTLSGGVALGEIVGSTFTPELRIYSKLGAVYQWERTPNIVGGHEDNTVSAGVYGAVVAGGGYKYLAASYRNIVTDAFGAIGGGANNRAGDNAGTADDMDCATIGGGFGNIASQRLATIGGGSSNTASAYATTVGGGNVNTASASTATVGGGSNNIASGTSATVGGGINNTAAFEDSTIGGGVNNATGALYATVGGGMGNTASGQAATVGGGTENTASGSYAAVSGGVQNTAGGYSSWAAGYRARATHTGSFVWGDFSASGVYVDSTATNQATFRTTGGVRFFTSDNLSTGVTLAAGGGSWTSVSDRNVKRDITSINPGDVLKRVVAMPISTWSYISEGGVRHMGPMAQDFKAAFDLGDSDRSITTVDADGVALAAIQGLERIVRDQDREIRALREDQASLASRLARLERGNGARASVFSTGTGQLGTTLGLGAFGVGLVLARRRRGEKEEA